MKEIGLFLHINCGEAGLFGSSFGGAIRPTSGARALDQGCAVMIAGLAGAILGLVLAAQS